MKPGILVGGEITHDCGLSRSIGWFIEGIIPIAPFCKYPLHITFTGITHDDLDFSIDILNNVTFPLLQNFGIYNVALKTKRRGVPPKGGGFVELVFPTIRSQLNSIYIIEEGLVKRIRGVAFSTRVSPTIITRMIESSRGVFNDFLPDVHISSDHYKGGQDGGDSPGFSLSLVAETTTGALLSIERTAKIRRDPKNLIPGTDHLSLNLESDRPGGEMPEDVGKEASFLLLQEIFSGGVIDRAHQPLILFLMALTPEDVSKIRLGELSAQAVQTLRILRDAFDVVFRIKEDKCETDMKLYNEFYRHPVKQSDSDSDSDDIMDIDEQEQKEKEKKNIENEPMPQRFTYLLSCLGTGYVNTNRKAT